MSAVWTGAWVAGRLGVEVATSEAPLGITVSDLAGLAIRRNPKRVQLLVSRVLGKHVPTDPRLIYASGRLLGLRVAEALGACPVGTSESFGPLLKPALDGSIGAVVELRDAVEAVDADVSALVLGNAETATALGHSVADALGRTSYLHSTRRPTEAVLPVGGYAEPHSHADRHLLQPAEPAFFGRDDVLVIVDDELSTGATAMNTISALHADWPRPRYVIAALIDMRSAQDAVRVADLAAELGTRVDVVSLASGSLRLAPQTVARAAQLVADIPDTAADSTTSPVEVQRVDVPWPADLAEGGRHGFGAGDRARLELAARDVAARIAAVLQPGGVHVLGTEEFMYLPLRVAEALADNWPSEVTYSTTTRSPVLAVDEPGYAIRTALRFDSHDSPADGDGPRFAYNLGTNDARSIVVITDEPADTSALHDGLLGRLGAVADHVLLVVLPAVTPSALPAPLYGPDFGSYRADDVSWLLKDLSHVALEAPTEEREEAIQAGGAHYAESLPVEYQPTPEYQQLFHDALAESAARLAHAVGVVTELVLQARGDRAVLVSLARAGTPVGVLMRRWARQQHGLDLPHYAVSIVRGRGIDAVALRYLARHHDPSTVMFVDGWTGKGAITRELTAAVAAANDALGVRFGTEMAVLADPGSCVEIFGTREDYLIPSACLNSTVSGLVSRTVLNDELIGPGDFHGAKFYAELAPVDVSSVFIDSVSARFAEVAADVARDWPELAASDRTPTWDGWRAVERISDKYGIGQANLVKPGVGETTRVLLRRVPWKILARRDVYDGSDLHHIRLLAQQRGVPVELVDELPYSCVGLIHPRYTRGAVGADGAGVT